MINDKKRKLLKFPLYCITAQNLSNGRDNITVVKEMLQGGAKIIQYREKYREIRTRYEECLAIRRLTNEAEALFIVNDNIDVALLVNADGVHIGQDDLPLKEVRRLVGEEMIIGLSTHSPIQAKEALNAGADYIGVGPVYATNTKDNVCPPVGLEYLKYVVNNIPLPYTAIGGIKEHNLKEVLSAGAKTICMVSEITGSDNISETVQRIIKKINKET